MAPKKTDGLSKLPPDSDSLYIYVKDSWEEILRLWKIGWAADQQLDALDQTIEFHRERIFDKKSANKNFDWELDWINANNLHKHNIDWVSNRKKHNSDLRDMWAEWEIRVRDHGAQISIESLRSVVLVNGAAIIAAIAVFTGQVQSPHQAVIWASKCTVILCSISLIMCAAGHAWNFEITNQMAGKVRGTLVGHPRHTRLYAVGRYLSKYMDPVIYKANMLIYGSIVLFGVNALVCAAILFFAT